MGLAAHGPFWIQPMTLEQSDKAKRRIDKYKWMQRLRVMPVNADTARKYDRENGCREDREREQEDWRLWLSAGEWSPVDEIPDSDERME